MSDDGSAEVQARAVTLPYRYSGWLPEIRVTANWGQKVAVEL